MAYVIRSLLASYANARVREHEIERRCFVALSYPFRHGGGVGHIDYLATSRRTQLNALSHNRGKAFCIAPAKKEALSSAPGQLQCHSLAYSARRPRDQNVLGMLALHNQPPAFPTPITPIADTISEGDVTPAFSLAAASLTIG